MTTALESPSIAQIGRIDVLTDEQPKSKARRDLLLLIIALEMAIQKEVDRAVAELIGMLAVMDSVALQRSRRLVEMQLRLLAARVDNLTAREREKAAELGLTSIEEQLRSLVGNDRAHDLTADRHFALQASQLVMAHGYRGVPFSDEVLALAAAAALVVNGRIQRGLMAEEEFRIIAEDIRARITGKRTVGTRVLTERGSFVSKASIEARTDLADAYTMAKKVWGAENQSLLTGYDWLLSAAHPKKDVCDDFAEKSPYPPNAPELKEFRPHPNCLCDLRPRFSEALT